MNWEGGNYWRMALPTQTAMVAGLFVVTVIIRILRMLKK